MFDLISIGDARIDNFVKLEDAHLLCRKNSETCELCLRYGDKIPVESFQMLCAGNNANNAVGSARLNLKTAIYCMIGEDGNGHLIKKHLKDEGVDIRYVVENKGMASENSVVINFQGERTILVFHQPWSYDLPDLDRTKWIYFSSVSYSFHKTQLVKQLENDLERTGAKLAFTPGTHQLNYGVKKYPRLLSLTTVLLVNLEEAKKILGFDIGEHIQIKKLLKGLADLGPRMVVITDGGNGSYCFDGERYYKMGIFPAKLVEMTGSGDAFATATIAALIHNQPLAEAVRWGAANGAAVVEEIGPQEGLLTYQKMQERLKQHPKVVAKEI